MAIIICDDKCPKCKTNLVKDTHCGGDYHFTVSGYVLMRFCPSCGVMRPIIEYPEPGYVSTRTKRHIANLCAVRYKRGFTELRKIVSSLGDITDISDFIDAFAHKSGLPIRQVFVCVSEMDI